jgi:hypothetical protein
MQWDWTAPITVSNNPDAPIRLSVLFVAVLVGAFVLQPFDLAVLHWFEG